MVKVLLACTGSVATIKIPEIIEKLKETLLAVEIRLVVTENAKHFVDLSKLDVKIYSDSDEWDNWSKIGDPILHIDLRNWADIYVISPLDANTLGKLASGICDNLVTYIARAWSIHEKPLIFCPAMNTLMWKHPATDKSIAVLKEWKYIEVPPIVKKLACGDEGIGALASVDSIVSCIAHNCS